MRQLSFIILAAALISTGCSHKDKKPDAPLMADAKATAQKTAEKAKGEVKKATSSDTKVECSVKGDERILEVRDKGKGCELAYTKAGKEGVVASAANGKEYCSKALEKLREKLKGSGYVCK